MNEKYKEIGKKILIGVGSAGVAFGITYGVMNRKVNEAEEGIEDMRQRGIRGIELVQEESREKLRERDTYIADLEQGKESQAQEIGRLSYRMNALQGNKADLQLKYEAEAARSDSLGQVIKQKSAREQELNELLAKKKTSIDSLANDLVQSQRREQLLQQDLYVYQDSLYLERQVRDAIIKGGSWRLFTGPDYGEKGKPSYDISRETSPVVPYREGFIPDNRPDLRERQRNLRR